MEVLLSEYIRWLIILGGIAAVIWVAYRVDDAHKNAQLPAGTSAKGSALPMTSAAGLAAPGLPINVHWADTAVVPPMPRVLIVDDSKVVRIMLERLLSEQGFRVTSAEDGVIALKKLQEGNFQLVITDIEMPNLDGFGLIAKIKENLKTSFIPIIAMTGHSEFHLDIGLCKDINGFIPKPWNDGDVLRHAQLLTGLAKNRPPVTA
jgi:chemosensory pili system protein ChpA (sensor histidine kinase/response regulator)